MSKSTYKHCACNECLEIVIGYLDEDTYCDDCIEADCESSLECQCLIDAEPEENEYAWIRDAVKQSDCNLPACQDCGRCKELKS